MPVKFQYHAKNKQGEYLDGEIEGETQNDALAKLELQGFWVIKLNALDTKGKIDAASTVPAFKSEYVRPSAAAANKFPIIVPRTINQILKNTAALITCVCLVLLPIILKFYWREPVSKGPVNFKIIDTQDLSSAPDYLRYGYIVEIPSGAQRGDVRKIAETLQAQKMKKDSKIQEVMFRFYYEGQNVEQEKPAAILQWNWDKSKDWEYLFNLNNAASEKKGGIMEVQQKEVQPGESVTYNFLISNDMTIPGAQKAAKNKILELKKQWSDATQISVNLIFDGFDDPFAACILKSSTENADCKVLK